MADRRVIEIIRDPENFHRVLLTLDDGTVVGPYLVMSVERIGLHVGNVCDVGVQEALSREDAIHFAIEDAVSYVKRKSRTESEILRFLTNDQDYDKMVAIEALNWLRKYHAVNDGEIVNMTVSAAQHILNTPSKMALTAKLLRRGVTKEQISKVFQSRDYDEFRGALQAGRKKLDQIDRKLEKEGLLIEECERKRKALLGAYLGRKGYTSATIHKVFEHLLG